MRGGLGLAVLAAACTGGRSATDTGGPADRADFPSLYQACDADVGCAAPLTCELVPGWGEDSGITTGEAARCTLACGSDADCPTCEGVSDPCDEGVCNPRAGCVSVEPTTPTTLP